MEQLNVAFEKYIEHNGKNIFKLLKTNTNKYYLIDCETKKILAKTKIKIIEVIKDYGIKNNLEENKKVQVGDLKNPLIENNREELKKR